MATLIEDSILVKLADDMWSQIDRMPTYMRSLQAQDPPPTSDKNKKSLTPVELRVGERLKAARPVFAISPTISVFSPTSVPRPCPQGSDQPNTTGSRYSQSPYGTQPYRSAQDHDDWLEKRGAMMRCPNPRVFWKIIDREAILCWAPCNLKRCAHCGPTQAHGDAGDFAVGFNKLGRPLYWREVSSKVARSVVDAATRVNEAALPIPQPNGKVFVLTTHKTSKTRPFDLIADLHEDGGVHELAVILERCPTYRKNDGSHQYRVHPNKTLRAAMSAGKNKKKRAESTALADIADSLDRERPVPLWNWRQVVSVAKEMGLPITYYSDTHRVKTIGLPPEGPELDAFLLYAGLAGDNEAPIDTRPTRR